MPAIEAVVVSGAGRGIGKAIALDLGGRGLHVVCISKSANADTTRNEIVERGGSAESLFLDLSQCSETERAVCACGGAHTRWGIVLAAGILGPTGSLAETNLDEWRECMDVNVLGNLAAVKGLLGRMIAARFGRILAFAGGGSAYAYPLFPAYSASKTAMVRAVENLNKDLEGKGDFAVACLAPGAVETDMLARVREAGAEIKTTTDIAEPVHFAREFLFSTSCGFSGSFVHVRDNWPQYLNNGHVLDKESLWKLRRVEA
jgi:NAD(P)-dependent dehydrogenase (short-subunit alcohol dehydrogenase family)